MRLNTGNCSLCKWWDSAHTPKPAITRFAGFALCSAHFGRLREILADAQMKHMKLKICGRYSPNGQSTLTVHGQSVGEIPSAP